MTIHQRLYINIDHIATVRQARRGAEPVPAHAVAICEAAGADGITAHLREDRRHVQDTDISAILAAVTTAFNLEIACTDEMIALAEQIHPLEATLVPERREEVTTEGGLDVAAAAPRLRAAIDRLRAAGVRSSLFVDPDRESITRSRDLGADAVELHTGSYAHAPANPATLAALRDGAHLAESLGLRVHAGHGLTRDNVGPVAAIAAIEELNIGHAIIARSIFIGLHAAVREMRDAMDAARGAP